MITRGTSPTFDKQQRQARIDEATATITSIEEALGTAVLEADEVQQSELRVEREHQREIITDERAAITILDRRIAEADVLAKERAIERQRLELYEFYAEFLPLRANMLRTHSVFLQAQKDTQAINNSGRLPLLRSHLVRSQITHESPSGPLGDGGNDPEQVEADAERFRKLVDELRKRLED